jgi:RNA polymerase sigma-70 factor (ECF subfamily)
MEHVSLDALWLAHRADLTAFVLSAVRDVHEADDVVQETALVVSRRAGDFEPGTNFGAWVREIARRILLDHARRRARPAVTLTPEVLERLAQAASELDGTDRSERLASALRKCVEKADEQSRAALRLRYEEGSTVDAIARALGRTVQATYALLKRARQAVRDCAEARLRKAGGP